jgi:FkbM family methyltransferase
VKLPSSLSAARTQVQEELGISWNHYLEDLEQLFHLRWLGFVPQTIFDIGASNTVWSVMAHKVFPSALFELFEPLAELSDAYSAGKKEHPAVRRFLERARFNINPIALGETNGDCAFRWFINNEAGSTSLQIDYESSEIKIANVPVWRLDDFVRHKSLPWPDLIKMDTQGSEMEILSGSQECLRRAKAIFIEGWLTKGYGTKTPLLLDIANLLDRHGFELFSVAGEYRNPDSILQTKDLVFVRRDLVLEATPAF